MADHTFMWSVLLCFTAELGQREILSKQKARHMEKICTYQIEVKGKIDQKAFNAGSPILIELEKQDQNSARFTALADQSGLIGLIRHLHHQGFLVLSVLRKEE